MIAATYLIFAYLLGSIPTGYWLGRAWKGIDVRQHGSGNLGATNVFRVLGKGPGFITLIIDILKGVIPVLGASHVPGASPMLPLLAGIAAIVGHTTSIFVQFRGGKGVATSTGVFAALAPLPSCIAFVTFLIIFSITRIVSLGSMIAALVLAVATWILMPHTPVALAAAAIALFVLWTHRANIDRLMKGTEPCTGSKAH